MGWVGFGPVQLALSRVGVWLGWLWHRVGFALNWIGLGLWASFALGFGLGWHSAGLALGWLWAWLALGRFDTGLGWALDRADTGPGWFWS